MKLFVQCLRNGSNCLMSYEGQDQDTVTRLLSELGATNVQFITSDEYDAAVASFQKKTVAS